MYPKAFTDRFGTYLFAENVASWIKEIFDANIKGTIHIKLNEIANRHSELDKNKNIFVMCHTGTRSQTVVKWLKAKGYGHSVNVLGGIDAWAALYMQDHILVTGFAAGLATIFFNIFDSNGIKFM